MYDRGRFFAVTGYRLDNAPSAVEDRQEELLALHRRLFGDATRIEGEQPPVTLDFTQEPSETDRLLARRILDEHSEILQIWQRDESEGDFAFCCEAIRTLIEQFGPSLSDVHILKAADLIFRASSLFERRDRREKWTRQATNYATLTLTRALQAVRKGPSPEGFTAAQLMAMDLPEPRFIVEGLLAEGVTLLVGSPKKGKSVLALNIALAAAEGRPLWDTTSLSLLSRLGTFRTAKGNVLLLSLEDGPRRLKKRLRKMLQGGKAPENLHIRFDWPRADQGGLQEMDGWLASHPDKVLVIVDVLARFRKPVHGDRNIYEVDYQAIAGLHRLAEKHRVAILVLHHTRKAAAQDPLEMVSGTQGLAGAADAVLVFRRTPGSLDVTLSLQSRDLDERELALRGDSDRLVWDLIGRTQEVRLSGERQAILEVLRTEPLSPAEVAARLGKPRNAIKSLMWKMTQDGEVVSAGGGKYRVPESSGVN
jgi:hypothetical protein